MDRNRINNLQRTILCVIVYLVSLLQVLDIYEEMPKRIGNKKRNRSNFDEVVGSLSEDEFKSHTGLSRKLFNHLVVSIRPHLKAKKKEMAILSSGSYISTVMMLFVHQRLVKGAKPQDLEWIGVDPKHVWSSIWLPVAQALDKALDNIKFNGGDNEWLTDQAQQWSFHQKRKYGDIFSPGLICAGDGLIIEIKRLNAKEFEKTNIAIDRYWNRKGYYALNCQCFCDAWCRFNYFDIRWPGSTNDIIAYTQSRLYLYEVPRLPEYYYLALDEAYKSIKDGHHITPFSGGEISAADEAGNTAAANAMRTFNKIFCSDRITIERAFGQMVRKFPMFWGANPRTNFFEIILSIKVCAKLHNLCVDEFLCKRFGYASEGARLGDEYPHPNLPKTYEEYLSKMPNGKRSFDNYEIGSVLSTDVPDLSQTNLLNSGNSLRTTKDTCPNLPQRQFSDTNATLNVGIAMSNWHNEEGDRDPEPPTGVNRRVWQDSNDTRQRSTDADSLQSLTDFIANHSTGGAHILVENKSIARRMQFALKMKNDGLLFCGGPTSREKN